MFLLLGLGDGDSDDLDYLTVAVGFDGIKP